MTMSISSVSVSDFISLPHVGTNYFKRSRSQSMEWLLNTGNSASQDGVLDALYDRRWGGE
jgi:hypothetical protein